MTSSKSEPLTKKVKKLYLKLEAFKGLSKSIYDEVLILILITNLNPFKNYFSME